VQYYPNGDWIYRGQADKGWPLIPKAGRPDYFDRTRDAHRGCDPSIPPHDIERFDVWRYHAIAFTGSLPADDLECLAYAQHYGLATRLLDWTFNPLVALFFAAETHEDIDGVVNCYLPHRIVGTDFTLYMGKTPTVAHVAMYRPRPFDRRILQQDAAFTIHSVPNEPLVPTEWKPDERPKFATRLTTPFAADGVDLVSFVVKAHSKPLILKELTLIGVDRKRLFPDLEGLSAFCNWTTQMTLRAKENPFK
jgi:hypothetical protein